MEGFVKLKDVMRCLYNTMESYHIKRNLMDLPIYDVRPVVHGRWQSHGEGFKWVYICSVCGFVDGYPMNNRMNYCPNCGAKMEE